MVFDFFELILLKVKGIIQTIQKNKTFELNQKNSKQFKTIQKLTMEIKENIWKSIKIKERSIEKL